MRPQDMWRGLQIRDGAGQLENAVKAPRRKAQPVRRVAYKITTCIVQLNNLFDQSGRSSGIA